MTQFTVRRGTAHDLPEIKQLNLRNFGENMPGNAWKYHQQELPGHSYYVAEDTKTGDLVGTAGFFPSNVNLGNAIVPMAAVTEITVDATHRGQGVLHEMLAALENDDAFSAYPVVGLTASQATIYGRYGFGPAVYLSEYTIDTRNLAFSNLVDTANSVRFLPREKFLEVLPPLYDAYQKVTPGVVSRSMARWKFELEWPESVDTQLELHALVHEHGFARFHYEEQRKKLVVDEICTTTPEAYYALWQTLCGHNIQKELNYSGPTRSPLPYVFKDFRALETKSYYDFLWLRIRNVKAVLEATISRNTGSVILQLKDSYGTESGVYTVHFANGTISCEKSSEEPELTMDISILSMILLGEIAASALYQAGRITGSATAVELLDQALFSAKSPEAGTFF
ncbi:MAG: GNAT family N-acetyltransferase [Micrococcaceae bacterium]